MDVASVTMLWACFSNGMSIILPRKVKAPWKTEYKLPERMLENYRLLFLARTLVRREHFRYHLSFADFPAQLLRKTRANCRGQISFYPPTEAGKGGKILQHFNREEKKNTSDTKHGKLFISLFLKKIKRKTAVEEKFKYFLISF